MNPRSRLIVRADGSHAVGAGHLMRCLALTHAWRDRGGAVTFVTYCESDALVARLGDASDELVRLPAPHPSNADRARLLELAAHHPGATVALDGYGFDVAYHRPLRAAGHRLLLLDDHAHQPRYEADWILNQNTIATPALYAARAPGAALLLGPAFALLRSEFVRHRGWTRPPLTRVRRILVTLGGSDPDNVTLAVLRGLAAAVPADAQVRVIAGHSNAHGDSLRAFASAQPFDCTILTGVDDMPAELMAADVAVSAAGTTTWELAFLQLPALIVTTADNQGTNAAAMEQRGATRDLGRPDAGLAARVARELRALVADTAALNAMARAGRTVIDGQGAGRVVDALRALP
jgi:UDP-2,4-diacetamido-2,4,6-trideoxy-beta-L-altropyranose hydrolase